MNTPNHTSLFHNTVPASLWASLSSSSGTVVCAGSSLVSGAAPTWALSDLNGAEAQDLITSPGDGDEVFLNRAAHDTGLGGTCLTSAQTSAFFFTSWFFMPGLHSEEWRSFLIQYNTIQHLLLNHGES